MYDIRKCLSYQDVLLVPRHSNFETSENSDISYKYKNLPCPFESPFPIINSAMDTVCSKELLRYLHDELRGPITIHRFFNNVKDQLNFYEDCRFSKSLDHRKIFMTIGSLNRWKGWIETLIEYHKDHSENFSFHVDMAQGDTKSCTDTVKYIRKNLPDVNIMAGNIATKSGYNRLVEAGANFIRAGIGGGCFTPEMEVVTENRNKKIKNIKNGEFVYTHTGELKEVINLIKYRSEEEIIEVNGIECTKNHKFYVIHKDDQEKVTEDNIHEFSKWIRADQLTGDYLFVELE